jgi:hypothetical protein
MGKVELEGMRRKISYMFLGNLILGFISIADSLPSHIRTQYLFLLLGGIVMITSALSLIRVRTAKDLESLGTSSIQGFWVCASMGLGYLVSGPAPYFQASPITWVTNVIIGLILLLAGGYFLLKTSKETGVPLSV